MAALAAEWGSLAGSAARAAATTPQPLPLLCWTSPEEAAVRADAFLDGVCGAFERAELARSPSSTSSLHWTPVSGAAAVAGASAAAGVLTRGRAKPAAAQPARRVTASSAACGTTGAGLAAEPGAAVCAANLAEAAAATSAAAEEVVGALHHKQHARPGGVTESETPYSLLVSS